MMKNAIAGLCAVLLSLVGATSASAVDVCNYTVQSAMGVLCPIRPGTTACLAVSASIGPCEDEVKCFGGPGFFCSLKLIPKSGPERQCAFSSQRPKGFKCYAPARLLATRTPTQPAGDTPTFTPTETPPPEPSATPTGVPTGTATATATDTPEGPTPTATEDDDDTPTETPAQATPTDTPPAVTPTDTAPPATNTETPPATATATDAPTGTPTGTAAAALVLRF